MNSIIKFILFFTPYINLFEWKVDRFFKNIKSTDSIFKIRDLLLKYMKEDIVIVNVWMEKKYKGYKYLKKSNRRRMYRDVKKIVEKFDEEINKKGNNNFSIPSGFESDEKLKHLLCIMRFLKPGKYYNYIKTASFGKLLRDPNKKKLEGDCNQIVTLYAYLYSLKYPIDDLQIKLLEDHVCLHYRGIDIEATNGQFHKYKDYTHILPITEIISTNMLDLHDFREELSHISPRTFVKSAQLAYAISSLRELVDKNLQISYHNLALDAMRHNNFKTALFYSSKMRDKSLHSKIRHNEGIYYYKRNNFKRALKIFNSTGDKNMQKACYAGMYNKLLEKVRNIKTQEEFNKNRRIYREMLELARKMQDQKLTDDLRKMLR